ncbi:elongation factor G [Oceanispirochaeta crateris]|uniref:Elongation factor G n=1 Tax=Oceanispirochaeta crateris TaxID=2518645 RepID=A0A5C1QLI0_9SPIO|nr:elongation factor G [Oceanispirochaeta crateris]QEN07474.1 elongation factor G [Oceanispirochaeta crateris]
MAFTTDTIRNIAVCGHGGTGKTTLVEQILFNAGVISKAETVDSGRTVSDFTEEEIEKKISIHSSLTNVAWKDTKINIFDTPGSSDFVGEVVSSFRASESAVMLIGARSSVQIETVKLWRRLDARDMPRIAFINKMEKTRADFFKVLEDLKEFKITAIPLTIPMGQAENYDGVINLMNMKAYRKDGGGKEENAIDIPDEYKAMAEEYHLKMIEMAAEGDDELTEKYFEEGTLSLEDAKKGLREGLFDNRFVPVFCGSAIENSGITPLMDFIVFESPAPGRVEEPCVSGETSRMVSSDGAVSGIIFKTMIDKFAGKMSYVKVITGKLASNSEVYNSREEKKERVNKIFLCEGKDLKETNEVLAGDIAVLTKVESLKTNDTICTSDEVIHYKSLSLPHPVYTLAINAENQKEEDKMSAQLHKVAEEDLTFTIHYNEETKETVISGMGELHINIILEKLLKNYKINVSRRTPKVPYRETINSSAEAEYTHKKQSGGHGQYGKVCLRIHPLERGQFFEMTNDIKGGSISKGYMPGIEKGLLESMNEGFLAGYPLMDIGVSIFDGKEHPVDSSEMAFKLAAKHALKEAVEKAKPTLLEPVMNLTVFVEDQFLGDVLSDLSTKRGRVLDQKPVGGGIQSIMAQVPQGELMRYSIDLKSMTSGTGAFEVEFSHYDPVSGKIAQEIIKASELE